MLNLISAFSGFSVNDIEAAKEFYGSVLGLKLHDEFGGVSIQLPGDTTAWMYSKPNHEPATYTTLNFAVEDIDSAVDELAARGVTFEHYPGAPQDDKGIMRGKDQQRGPNIAWFTDPAGNILALVEI